MVPVPDYYYDTETGDYFETDVDSETDTDTVLDLYETVTTTSEQTKDPTCEDPGETTYTGVFTNPIFAVKTKTVQNILPTGHNYELTKWKWTGYTSAVATFTCKNDSKHTQTANATITSKRTEPTCEADGSIVYTAAVTFEGKNYTDTKTEKLAKKGHSFKLTGWSWDGDNAAAVFTCEYDKTHTTTVAADVTTRTEGNTVIRTANIVIDGQLYTDTNTEVITPSQTDSDTGKTSDTDQPADSENTSDSSSDAPGDSETDTSSDTASSDVSSETDTSSDTDTGKDVDTESDSDNTPGTQTDTDKQSDSDTPENPDDKPKGTCGDVDGDGNITANDALMILRASVGMETLTPEQSALADVDGDGSVTANDALAVLRYSIGFIDEDSRINKPITA